MVTVFDLACEVLAISFRLVIALVRRSKAIEPEAGLWATTFIRISKEELKIQLEDYNLHHVSSRNSLRYMPRAANILCRDFPRTRKLTSE
jgi:hypothetical protein